MSILNDCCQPCPTPPVNVPGPEGSGGTNGVAGADGVNAFTITTASFSLPSAAANVTVSVANSTWMTPGQNVFISDGSNLANFTVVSIPSSNSVALEYLDYTGDSSTGATINSGAGVSPSGLIGANGTSGFTVLGTISAAVGLSQALTTTPNTQVGSITLTLSATSGKKYLLFARCRFDYVGATIGNEAINFKIRRTNNTAGDIPNAVGNLQTAVVSGQTNTIGEITILSVPYTGQGVSDILQAMASISNLPYSGSIEAIECSLSAVELT
jgi:hypothetical protein